jgi:hypothetical protein
MTREPHPIDDDDVARLVRDVAAGWTMPPVRLDEPAWRDRVRSGRARRAANLQGWLSSLGQAATGAVVLTVAGALIAVYLTGAGKPQASTGPTASPGSSHAAAPSQLPQLFLAGELPAPSRVVVQTEGGQYALADLATGTLGSSFTATGRDSAIGRGPNGNLVCVCTSYDGAVFGHPTHLVVHLERFDGDLKVLSRDPVIDITGVPDPRDGQVPFEPDHVTAATTFSPDGRYAFVGWSKRNHPSWTSGIVVVDLRDGAIVDHVLLPQRSDGTGDGRTEVYAPRVVGTAGAGVIIARRAVSWSPATATDFSVSNDVDVFVTSFGADNGNLGDPAVSIEGGTGCGDDVNLAGGLPGGDLWLSCVSYDGSGMTTVRRVDGGGRIIGDTSVYGAIIEGATAVVSPDGGLLYVWDPSALVLHRVDLATGAETKASAPAATSNLDPLTALGRWLAPSTEAKTFLQPAVAISTDGSRVYAIGIGGDRGPSELSGSSGVLVFDATAMAPIGRWAPTADFVSLAISADGRFLYAAGAPGVGADGSQAPFQASMTVFDTGDGSVRVICGRLGAGMLTFPGATVQ